MSPARGKPRSRFRSGVRGAIIRGMMGLAAIAPAGVAATSVALRAFPSAAAQVTLSSKQCSDAISIANGIVHDYEGKISADLRDSFVNFAKSKCDMNTKFVRVDGTKDDVAYGRFRVQLVELLRTSVAQPAAYKR